MCNQLVLGQIEELRQKLNELYKLHSVITPELVELSAQLDHLLNKLQRSSIKM
ncbi:aspartyl-phosphate phosphatase Spo0E family protein [Brevibacillus humidisoli]|uniref:aspartyl-phosphate phosphatase Spo0E family protein n=1 Tax=Brevibacillus humidisoli TaxID=2895522 RepID=UPI001E3D7580|nr:aspartyl-phosphate phosphatase Spo0E family protein [Brevibacillus humidisoli]UFJ40703.1 aspartyl-phosphate phosphatase Spo0E family protein [Brevibacillus humidisoli]